MEGDVLGEGDTVRTGCYHTSTSKIVSVVRGRYGLLSVSDTGIQVYYPYELPTVDKCGDNWYNWPHRCNETVERTSMKLGCVFSGSMSRSHVPVAAYDAKWDETRRLQHEEQQAQLEEVADAR